MLRAGTRSHARGKSIPRWRDSYAKKLANKKRKKRKIKERADHPRPRHRGDFPALRPGTHVDLLFSSLSFFRAHATARVCKPFAQRALLCKHCRGVAQSFASQFGRRRRKRREILRGLIARPERNEVRTRWPVPSARRDSGKKRARCLEIGWRWKRKTLVEEAERVPILVMLRFLLFIYFFVFLFFIKITFTR